MSDTSPTNQRALQHDAPKAPPQQPKPGEEVWRLKHADGRVQSCELRDAAAAGAGWDVMMLEDGEPLFSRRCADERGARFVAESFKKDLLRTGWTEAERKVPRR
jgi:hypothetical protein